LFLLLDDDLDIAIVVGLDGYGCRHLAGSSDC
jgi:hypothetical protein